MTAPLPRTSSPVLIIEDSQDDLEAVRRAFRHVGISNDLHHAWTGEEALDYLRACGGSFPSLILLDLNMPGIGGRRALEIIKQDSALRDIPVVVLTTSNYDADIEMCYKAGANSYMQKPVNFDDLCKAVRSLTEYWLGTALLPPLRERAETMEKAKDAAERTSRAKTDFLANMSHELRTPLNSIIGMTRLLYEDKTVATAHHNMLGVVYRSAENLLVIVNDILDLSKVESGHLELENIVFSLEEVVDSVMETVTPLCGEKGLGFTCNFDCDPTSYLTGDPTRLARIMMNLLGNAVKYTEKGSITVNIACKPAPDGWMGLSFSVTDTGIGIAAADLGHIFEKFMQADRSITRRFGGTGLGLNITQRLVEKMQGRIGVESEFGKGSRFWFEVPFRTADVRPVIDRKVFRRDALSRLPESERKKAGQLRLLVADDHLLNQTFIKELLPRMGIGSFEVVSNGQQAVEAFGKNAYDLILMDCHMPVMSGFDAVREIRGREGDASRRMPIVAMTADAMTGTREHCLKAGMDDYISKPINLDELKFILGRWVTFPDESPAGEPSAPPRAANAAPADLEALRKFADTDKELRGFVTLLVSQSDETLQELQRNCGDGENTRWTEAAHKLKGGAAMIGAEKLRRLCEKAQEMRTATSAEREAMFRDIRAAWEDVERYLRERLVQDRSAASGE
ncbi:MAG: response regulator [Alphaproteobacteria bacterium]